MRLPGAIKHMSFSTVTVSAWFISGPFASTTLNILSNLMTICGLFVFVKVKPNRRNSHFYCPDIKCPERVFKKLYCSDVNCIQPDFSDERICPLAFRKTFEIFSFPTKPAITDVFFYRFGQMLHVVFGQYFRCYGFFGLKPQPDFFKVLFFHRISLKNKLPLPDGSGGDFAQYDWQPAKYK
jgi:hypothetical protein